MPPAVERKGTTRSTRAASVTQSISTWAAFASQRVEPIDADIVLVGNDGRPRLAVIAKVNFLGLVVNPALADQTGLPRCPRSLWV